MPLREVFFLTCCLFCVWGVSAAADKGPLEDYEDSTDYSRIEEAEPWKEEAITLPAYPGETGLLELPLGGAASPFRYFVDPKSVDIGKDQVVRYAVVIISRSGARNVLFEGIHCGERRFKTHAYGVSGNRWQPSVTAEWAPIRNSGSMRYRSHLYRIYMCDEYGATYPYQRIMQRLQDAASVKSERSDFIP